MSGISERVMQHLLYEIATIPATEQRERNIARLREDLSRTCPWCGMEPGMPCVTPQGSLSAVVHMARRA